MLKIYGFAYEMGFLIYNVVKTRLHHECHFVWKCRSLMHDWNIPYIAHLGFKAISSKHMSLSTTKYIMVSAQCIDPDQPAQSTQANPGQHISSQGDRGIE